MGKGMGMENIYGLMDHTMKGIGFKIKHMGKGS